MTKKDAHYVISLSAAFIAAITALNMYGSLKTFNFQSPSLGTVVDNGLLWYSGHASAPFAIHVQSFIFVAALSAVLFAATLRKNYFTKAIFLLFALNIAFNAFILFQSIYPTAGPQYEKTLKTIAADFRDSNEPLYAASQFRNSPNVYFGDERTDYYEPGKKGKLILIDLQLLDSPGFLKTGAYIESNCGLEKTYFSNNYPFAYVYDC